MQILIKAGISLAVIFAATAIGKKASSLAGLIAVMPLTGVLVLAWLYSENNGDPTIMQGYARGAFWGIIPSMLFFLVVYLCFKRELPLPIVLGSGFAAWLAGAFLHQFFLK